MRIRLQFSAQNTIGSAAIRWWTWSDYSHVDFVLPSGKWLGARGDGVKARDPYHVSRRLLVEVEAHPDVLFAALSQIGKPYDYTALLGFVIKRDWQETDSWFCSELVAWAFAVSDEPLIRAKELHRITPRDLLLSPFIIPGE